MKKALITACSFLSLVAPSLSYDYDKIFDHFKSNYSSEFAKTKKEIKHEVNSEFFESQSALKDYYKIGQSKNFQHDYKNSLYFNYLIHDLANTPNKIGQLINSNSGIRKLKANADSNGLLNRVSDVLSNPNTSEEIISKYYLGLKLYSIKHKIPIQLFGEDQKSPYVLKIIKDAEKVISQKKGAYNNFSQTYLNVYQKRKDNIVNCLTILNLVGDLPYEQLKTNDPLLNLVIKYGLLETSKKVKSVLKQMSLEDFLDNILQIEIAENGPYNEHRSSGRFGDIAGISYYQVKNLLRFGYDLTNNPIYKIAMKEDPSFKDSVKQFKSNFVKAKRAPIISNAKVNGRKTKGFYPKALSLYDNLIMGNVVGISEVFDSLVSKYRPFAKNTGLFRVLNNLSNRIYGESLTNLINQGKQVKQLKKSKNYKRVKAITSNYESIARGIDFSDIRTTDAGSFVMIKIISDLILSNSKITDFSNGEIYRLFNSGSGDAKKIFKVEKHVEQLIKNKNIDLAKATNTLYGLIQDISYPKKLEYYPRNLLANDYCMKTVLFKLIEDKLKKENKKLVLK